MIHWFARALAVLGMSVSKRSCRRLLLLEVVPEGAEIPEVREMRNAIPHNEMQMQMQEEKGIGELEIEG